MREVVLRIPRAGGTPPSSAWVRGTELARVETRRRSGWSSLRLRRKLARLGSLKLRPLRRPIRLWDTTSSKRSRCFLGMKILANIEGIIRQNESGKGSKGCKFSLHFLLFHTEGDGYQKQKNRKCSFKGISQGIEQLHPPPSKKAQDSFSESVLLPLQDPLNWLKYCSVHTVSREGRGKKEGMSPTPDAECVCSGVQKRERKNRKMSSLHSSRTESCR